MRGQARGDGAFRQRAPPRVPPSPRRLLLPFSCYRNSNGRVNSNRRVDSSRRVTVRPCVDRLAVMSAHPPASLFLAPNVQNSNMPTKNQSGLKLDKFKQSCVTELYDRVWSGSR